MSDRLEDLTDEQRAAKELTELYHAHPEAFKGLVKMWIMWDSLGMLGVGLKNILTVIAFLVGSWIVAKSYLSDWIVSIMSGPK